MQCPQIYDKYRHLDLPQHCGMHSHFWRPNLKVSITAFSYIGHTLNIKKVTLASKLKNGIWSWLMDRSQGTALDSDGANDVDGARHWQWCGQIKLSQAATNKAEKEDSA